MNHLVEAIRLLVPHWNERAFTAEDFYRTCRRLRIRVFEMPLMVPGFYMKSAGRRFIFLNVLMGGDEWLRAAFHELGHALLHTPPSGTSAFFFRLSPDSRQEHEAEIFAVVALIPEWKLRLLLSTPREEWEAGITQEMVGDRLKILELYEI